MPIRLNYSNAKKAGYIVGRVAAEITWAGTIYLSPGVAIKGTLVAGRIVVKAAKIGKRRDFSEETIFSDAIDSISNAY